MVIAAQHRSGRTVFRRSDAQNSFRAFLKLYQSQLQLCEPPIEANEWWWIWGPWVATILGAQMGDLCYDVLYARVDKVQCIGDVVSQHES